MRPDQIKRAELLLRQLADRKQEQKCFYRAMTITPFNISITVSSRSSYGSSINKNIWISDRTATDLFDSINNYLLHDIKIIEDELTELGVSLES